MSLKKSYAALPYMPYAHRHTDPSVFGVIAHLAGVKVTPPSTARILDIGCAVGGNLAPLAARFPSATCVGIDLSDSQIATAREWDPASTYLAMDLTELSREHGEFDYVIAHGVYSWVPDSVREVLFDRIRSVLAPNGVATVSYNVLPGWYARQAVRDMMLENTRGIDDPKAVVQRARQMLGVLASNATDGPHKEQLREQAKYVQEQPDGWLYHDYLAAYNTPFWHRDVVAHATRSGLTVVGDAAMHTAQLRSLDPDAARLFQSWAADAVAWETWLDLLRDRSFRQTVFVRDDVAVTRDVSPSDLHGLHLRTSLVNDGEGRFVDGDRSIAARDPAMTALLMQLGDAYPGSMPFAASQSDETAARAFFGLSNGAITPTLASIPAVRPSRTPRLWSYARTMAARGETSLTNLAHETIPLPADVVKVAKRLDGRIKPRSGWAKAVGLLAANAFFDA